MAMDALYAGVTGLQVNQQMLDVVGNNLANSNTPGFKSQSVNFSDLVYQNITQATAAQRHGGRRHQSYSDRFRRPSRFRVAEFPTGDFAVNRQRPRHGLARQRIFRRAQWHRGLVYAPGSFGVDANNYLVDPATGNRVQRFGTVGEASPTVPLSKLPAITTLTFPFGTGVPGSATSNVVFARKSQHVGGRSARTSFDLRPDFHDRFSRPTRHGIDHTQ